MKNQSDSTGVSTLPGAESAMGYVPETRWCISVAFRCRGRG